MGTPENFGASIDLLRSNWRSFDKSLLTSRNQDQLERAHTDLTAIAGDIKQLLRNWNKVSIELKKAEDALPGYRAAHASQQRVPWFVETLNH